MASRVHVLQFCLPFIAERAEGPWPINDDDGGPDDSPRPPKRQPLVPAIDAIADSRPSDVDRSRMKEAARATRDEQFARAALKLRRLVAERPFAAGIVEWQIDRLLAGKAAA